MTCSRPFAATASDPRSAKTFLTATTFLISPADYVRRVVACRALWKIHLARLVKNQEAWHGVMGRGKEKQLKGHHQRDMIGKPVRAAADLP